jgi:hypothetical protein
LPTVNWLLLILRIFIQKGERIVFDIKDWLLEGLVLREGVFREKAAAHDWSQYKDTFVALTCSTDAIIPAWAYMLLSTYLQPYAKKVIVGRSGCVGNDPYTQRSSIIWM